MKNEEKEVGVKTTTKKDSGTIKVTETKKSFDELLKDKDYQSEFDKKITQALQTAKANWKKKNYEFQQRKNIVYIKISL